MTHFETLFEANINKQKQSYLSRLAVQKFGIHELNRCVLSFGQSREAIALHWAPILDSRRSDQNRKWPKQSN